MQLKNNIALLLLVIFLGKFSTVDAGFLEFFLHTSGVTLVNKTCPKKQLMKKASEAVSSAKADQELEMNFLCHTVFDQRITALQKSFTADNFQKYNYQAPEIFSTPREKFYPPPKA